MNEGIVVQYKFGPFQLDPENNVLTHNGEAVILTPKAFATVKHLVMKKGGLVTAAELSEKVWARTQICGGTISQNIYTLRKTLGALSGGQSFIQTIPKRGYCFVAPVEEITFPPANHSQTIIPGFATQFFHLVTTLKRFVTNRLPIMAFANSLTECLTDKRGGQNGK